MRTRCRGCGNIASTNYPCKTCGSDFHVRKEIVFLMFEMWGW